jgi:hypothetical protein
MRLRIRHAQGMTTFSALNPEDTVARLKSDISDALALSFGQNVESNALNLTIYF